MAAHSKLLTPAYHSCQEYVHPWTPSCYNASAGLFLHALKASFKMYLTVYILALLMKGKKPTKKDLKKTLHGILQSTAFIGCHAVGFSLLACLFRNISGQYNFFTFAFLPTFVSSWFAILVERPSRRALLSLYVTNIASETLYQMFIWRRIAKPLPFADVLIFSSSMSFLLYLYRNKETSSDSIYSLIRFIVGPYEQIGYVPRTPDESAECSKGHALIRRLHNSNLSASLIYQIIVIGCHISKKIKDHLKSFSKGHACVHPNSCAYYCLQGGTKVFVIGYGLQLSLRILMQMKRMTRHPWLIIKAMKNPDTFTLGAFLGGFSFLYRLTSCLMRRTLDRDMQSIAIPAGFVAGLSFCFYRTNTIAMYVMWKSLQILYMIGRDNSVVPNIPYASIIFHCLSTSILFHAALFEPQNLRSSYWNFLQNMSGGRIAQMDRRCLDLYGLESQKMLEMMSKKRHR